MMKSGEYCSICKDIEMMCALVRTSLEAFDLFIIYHPFCISVFKDLTWAMTSFD